MPKLRDLPNIVEIIRNDDGVEFVVITKSSFRRFIDSLDLTGKIDEAAYLRRYPDVERSISRGRVASATEHFKKAGYLEMRQAKSAK